MHRFRIGIIRVLTTEDEKELLSHQRILEGLFPEFIFESKCIPDQYEGIYNSETLKIAFPKIVKLAQDWEPDLDGLIISCAADPALDYLRKILSIPVAGAGISAACMAMNYGEKIGIIGIEKSPPAAFKKILGDKIISNEMPQGVKNTKDLRTPKGKKAVLNSALKLKEMGCDTIALACTGLSTSGAATLLKDVGVPIVDAVAAEGMMIKFMLIEVLQKAVSLIYNE